MGFLKKLFGPADLATEDRRTEQARKREERQQQEMRKRLALLQTEIDVLRRATD